MPNAVRRDDLARLAEYPVLLTRVRETFVLGQQKADELKVQTYWEAGRLIHEHLRHHQSEAGYGKQLMLKLARGLDVGDELLYRMLRFYEAFPISSGRRKLTWTHYRTLARLPDKKKRLERDVRWAEDTVGGSQETLASVGCTVCSLAMALDHYGVKVTPKELNDFLKKNGGYTERGWLKWDSVSKVSKGKVVMGYIGNPSFQRIDAALKNNQPVIAKVFIDRTVPHWVLIVGKENTEYLIRDPLGDGKSLRQLSFYGSDLHAIRILKAAR